MISNLISRRGRIRNKIKVKVANHTTTPGPRKINEGDFSGEWFLNEILRPKYEEAEKDNATLFIDLDGAIGYPPSFLEEAFGTLSIEKGAKQVIDRLELKCEDEPYLIEEIESYIEDAE
jgi:hypothetical protein